MIPVIEEKSEELAELCRRYNVRRLELFGSAATGKFVGGVSDFDFLVEFLEFPEFPLGGYADCYFGLLKGLETLFNAPVDLVVDSAIKNPYFRKSVDMSRTLVYAANGV